jgi:hypothetical protein
VTQADDLQSAYQKVIRDVLPSVVQIEARSDLGSGVVYDDGGTSSPTRTSSVTRRPSG